MGNLFCPNITSEDYIEIVKALNGDEDHAHYLWNKNNGNPIDKDHKGNPSLLFEDLLGYTYGDRLEAIRLKSIVFNHKFMDRFGNWTEIEYTPENNNVYDNGEPQMDNILDVELMNIKKPGHMDTEVSAAIDRYNKKGVDGEALITDNNNPYSWKIEEQLGLIEKFVRLPGDILKTKYYKGFTDEQAHAKIKEVEKLGGWGYFIPQIDGKFGVGVGYKIGRPINKKAASVDHYLGGFSEVSLINLAGIDFVVDKRDSRKIKTALNQLTDGKTDALTQLNKLMNFFATEFNEQPEVKETAKLFLSNRQKAPNIKIEVKDSNEDGDYMEYSSTDNTIILYSKTILEDPTAKGFVASFSHEIGHAFLSKALEVPKTIAEKKFKETMTQIFSEVKLHSVLNGSSNQYGLTNVHEFTTTFLNDSKFASDLNKYNAPRTFYQRIIDAIAEFFYAFTGYEFRKDHGDSLQTHVHKTITDFINKTSSYYDSNSYKNGVIYQKHKAAVRQEYQDIKKSITPSTLNPKDITSAFQSLEKMFDIKRTSDEHSYKEKSTGVYFQSTTQLMAESGLSISEKDIAKMGDVTKVNFKRSANLGNAIHLTLQGKTEKITNDILKETGFVVSEEASLMLSNVLKDIRKVKGLEGKGVTILSEVFICDPYKQTSLGIGLAGSIDLVIIDSMGRVHLFDFKTKESGWQYYITKQKSGYSELQKDQTQLGIYKHMIENTLGIPVFSMNVVMLKPTVTKNIAEDVTYNTIGSVSLDTSITGTGIDTFSKEGTLVNRLYGERPNKFNASDFQMDLIEDADYKNSIEYKLKLLNSKKLSEVEKIHKDTVQILEDKLEIIRKRYSYSRFREFEEFVNQVAQESSSSAALSAIIIYAAEISNKYIERYIQMVNRGDTFTPQLLMEWRDYITSYDSLNRLSLLLKENPSLLNEPKIIELLDGVDGVTSNINRMKEIFEKQGKILIAKKLAPHYNGFKIRRKEELEKKYRRLAFRYEHGKGERKIHSDVYDVDELITNKELDMFLKGTTMEDYVNANLLIEKDALDRLTYEMLVKELSVASSDVNEATRWLDTLEDSSDPAISAMLSSFTVQDEKSRIEALKKRVEIVRLLRKVEQLKGRTNATSEKKLWKSILEEDSGELTNYLIRPWLSKLDVEEKAVRKANRSKTDKRAREDMQAWTKENFPLNKFESEYFTAFRGYLEKLVQLDQLKEDEKEAIMDNETDRSPKPITVLSEWTADPHNESDKKTVPPLISDEAADIALQWRTKNRKLFSDINEKWINPQWEAFARETGVNTNLPIALQMDEMAKSDNSMAQMYIMLTQLAESADSSLPYHYRLGYRLPGVSKTKNERLREGQNIKTAIKETVALEFLKKAEDTLYQDSKEFTDEKGNPKYFLPVHYTAKLKGDEQSYDLPTIYYKFWEMANDHHNKKQMLPELEMAKYFIQSRKTERKNTFGGKMMRMVRGGRQVTEDDVSLSNTSRTSAMLEDWFQMYVYGNNTVESKFKIGNYVFDGQKLTSGLQGFVSLNLLAFNVVQATANIVVGDIYTNIDAIAGEWINPKSIVYGHKMYAKWFMGMLNDVGNRVPSHVGSMLIEEFNVLSEDNPENVNLSNSTKLKGFLKSSATSVFQIGGEHWLRSKPFFAMLGDIKAIEKETGKDLGPMLEQYYSDNGELKLRENVDLKASKWEEEDRLRFFRKFHGIMANINGNYGSMERVAAQRYIIGQLAYMYRKFIMPGIKRRYRKMEYVERMQQSVEGSYVTTAKFFSRLAREMHGIQMAVAGEEWAALSPHEKANIKRTLAEVVTLISTITLASFAYSSWSDADDPDEAKFWAFIAYQAYRLKAEMLFYSPKLDETMSLLRSPMASMSLAENIIKLTDQLFAPFEVYERGPWKGHLKLERDMVQFVPIYKQWYKFRDIEEQIQWFR